MIQNQKEILKANSLRGGMRKSQLQAEEVDSQWGEGQLTSPALTLIPGKSVRGAVGAES